MNWNQKVKKAKEYILSKNGINPEVGLILGSGWEGLDEKIKKKVKIPYNDIPFFHSPGVEGHKGELILGEWPGGRKNRKAGKKVCIMQGRIHFYEGYSMQEIAYPVMVMKALGVKILIITNASGAINESFSCGDLVLISDHINLMGSNPLLGWDTKRVRFLNLSNVYDEKLINLAKICAKRKKIKIKEGVYVATSGPAYETPAEIRLMCRLGGDLVGMSTVPEVIMAGYLKMRVLAVACIANVSESKGEKISHRNIIKNMHKFRKNLVKLVEEILFRI